MVASSSGAPAAPVPPVALSAAPPAADDLLAIVLAWMPRPLLERLAQGAIDRLDAIDAPTADLEPEEDDDDDAEPPMASAVLPLPVLRFRKSRPAAAAPAR